MSNFPPPCLFEFETEALTIRTSIWARFACLSDLLLLFLFLSLGQNSLSNDSELKFLSMPRVDLIETIFD